MLKRIITGILLIGLIVGMFFLRTIDARLFNILTFLCAFVGTIEMLRALGEKLTFVQRSIVLAFSICFVPTYVFCGAQTAAAIAFTAIVLCFATLVFEFEKASLESVTLSVFALVYPTIMLSPIMLMNDLGTMSLTALLLAFVIAPCADTFAYFVGTIFKGRQLSPKISPKKTVSGAVGGILGGAIGSLVVWGVAAKGQITDFVAAEVMIYLLIGFIGAIISIIGDLFEGAIKRKLGIKDMGYILPGHGGVLDRIDGILACSMFVYLVFMFLA